MRIGKTGLHVRCTAMISKTADAVTVARRPTMNNLDLLIPLLSPVFGVLSYFIGYVLYMLGPRDNDE